MLPAQSMRLPFKSPAGALLLSLVLGPVGLLYASLWGGIVMLVIGFVVVPTRLPVPIVIVWLVCCIWSMVSVNRFNQTLLKKIIS